MEKKKTPSYKTKKEDTITIKRSQVYAALLPVMLVIGVLGGLLAGYLLWGRNSGTNPLAAADNGKPAATQKVVVTPTSKPVRYTVPAGDAPALGPANAPVTIIEFSDFECPFCQKWQQEVYPKLMANYADKVRFVFRNFPLSGHSSAIPAAEASLCANEQSQFWAYHDKLFSLQYPLETASYPKYASDLGLDLVKFNDCMSTHRYLAKIQSDVDFASKLGVDQTPTFFINGLAVLGAQPYEFFQQIIDQELAGQIK
jgi:protein-disulfide isomerase